MWRQLPTPGSPPLVFLSLSAHSTACPRLLGTSFWACCWTSAWGFYQLLAALDSELAPACAYKAHPCWHQIFFFVLSPGSSWMSHGMPPAYWQVLWCSEPTATILLPGPRGLGCCWHGPSAPATPFQWPCLLQGSLALLEARQCCHCHHASMAQHSVVLPGISIAWGFHCCCQIPAAQCFPCPCHTPSPLSCPVVSDVCHLWCVLCPSSACAMFSASWTSLLVHCIRT